MVAIYAITVRCWSTHKWTNERTEKQRFLVSAGSEQPLWKNKLISALSRLTTLQQEPNKYNPLKATRGGLNANFHNFMLTPIGRLRDDIKISGKSPIFTL